MILAEALATLETVRGQPLREKEPAKELKPPPRATHTEPYLFTVRLNSVMQQNDYVVLNSSQLTRQHCRWVDVRKTINAAANIATTKIAALSYAATPTTACHLEFG